jgi:hypothetical protein
VKKHNRYISTFLAVLVTTGLSLSAVHFHTESHSHHQAEYTSVDKDLPCTACITIKYYPPVENSTTNFSLSVPNLIPDFDSIYNLSLFNLISERAPPA